MGERIGMDVLNTIYDTSVAIVDQHADSGDYEGFKLELFKTFAMESPITEEEFKSAKADKTGRPAVRSRLAASSNATWSAWHKWPTPSSSRSMRTKVRCMKTS